MPESSPPRKFIESLRTGRTDTTKALDQAFTSPGSIATDPAYAELWAEVQRKNGLHVGTNRDHLPPQAKAVLRAAGLKKRELDHIGEWPPKQKELVRKRLVNAINTNRRIHFIWQLHGGDKEDTDFKDDGVGDITITFHSPQKNVSINAAGTNIKVKVGP